MGIVTVVGVRHHSPACARLVRRVIEEKKPRFVLVEGPCDMNERMVELLLPHALPIALFTWRQDVETGISRGTWTPFCAYSPEWVAVHAAKEVGATPLFVDLPAWHEAFDGEENRFSDRHARTSDAIAEICARLGFEGLDSLWDHLFEGRRDESGLDEALARYFEALRADEPAGERDTPREDHMARWIAWAAAQGGEVVVVCGGYHKPALERLWATMPAERPALRPPERARIGSYYVPFSFKRLDSFSGYASGMPSPGFYQAVWEDGATEGAERMLHHAVKHLRAKAQRVSVADAIAAQTLADGLRMLRGHEALARIDVLDGLAGALVKDALDAPLPWTKRGVLPVGTDPLLVEIVAAFSGDRVGELADGTPRPPLALDAFEELSRVGLSVGRSEKRVRVDLATERGVAQSHVLHRLRVLRIPGFVRIKGPSLERNKTRLEEQWTIVQKLETDAGLVEAALYGATLETAAAAKLEEATRDVPELTMLAEVLVDAALAGIAALTSRWLSSIEALVATEPSFAVLGAALGRLLLLFRGEAVLSARETQDLARVIEACFTRGLWLFEGITGANAPAVQGLLDAVRAMRDATRAASGGRFALDEARARAVCDRRVVDVGAPSSIRGAALGYAWSVWGREEASEEAARAVVVLKSVARADTMGDFLAGLFALAREEVLRTPELLAAIDVAVTDFTQDDFFVALPALRQAFAYFPPRERLGIAESLVEASGLDPMALLDVSVDATAAARGHERDRAARALASRFGLGDAQGEEES